MKMFYSMKKKRETNNQLNVFTKTDTIVKNIIATVVLEFPVNDRQFSQPQVQWRILIELVSIIL